MDAMLGNPVFSCFVFYSTLLILKMYTIAVITGQVRLRKKAFANPEDAERHGGVQFCRTDPDVDRCRRAHINDMENIFPFLFLGAIYSMTGPSLVVAQGHFLVFFVGRVMHSVAYLFALKAPTRSLAYTIAQVPCVSMAIQILFTVGFNAWPVTYYHAAPAELLSSVNAGRFSVVPSPAPEPAPGTSTSVVES